MPKSKKRKSRSHGRRQNGNIRRRRCKSLTLQECLNVLNTGGRHLLLSSISSLPLSQLRLLEQEADKIILRTDKLNTTYILEYEGPMKLNVTFLKVLSLIKGLTLLILIQF